MTLEATIKQLAAALSPQLIEIRRYLHANPELSYQEYKTQAYVAEKLTTWGIPFTKAGNTGLVAIINGMQPESRVMALRADMDALPIAEANEVDYRSKVPGIMHACGHDAHTACLLGAANILLQTRHLWYGTVKLIFQPGEEKNPGGATLMIRDGVLDSPKPEGIIALHVHPSLPVGKLSFRTGTVMASADEIYITIKGKGGHAAAPHLTTDTILVAAHLVVSLQQIISRNNNTLNPSVLSITSFQGGQTTNVIPAEVKLMGTLRCLNEQWRAEAHNLINRHVAHICTAMGAQYELHIDKGYPTVYNNPELTLNAWKLAENYLGSAKVEETEMRMGAEDFGYYAQEIPGCFYRLGVRNEAKGITSSVHTPTFDIDEEALAIGAGTMAWLGAQATV
ncbi:MAG: M20 family metallopeptidase [Chitinophagaceae bacterium]|nr:M20 family metallopeptidase [Chitinophagaceae bacterium]